jgi:hypothetical protein
MEILKVVITLLGGGLAGAFFNEWLRRRRSGVQRIPLVERVNRRVSSELKGFTLARTVDDPSGRKLEEVRSLREYQLTLRNSSPVHLKDADIQFEFPADEVQGWASRPALSRTALVLVGATVEARARGAGPPSILLRGFASWDTIFGVGNARNERKQEQQRAGHFRWL